MGVVQRQSPSVRWSTPRPSDRHNFMRSGWAGDRRLPLLMDMSRVRAPSALRRRSSVGRAIIPAVIHTPAQASLQWAGAFRLSGATGSNPERTALHAHCPHSDARAGRSESVTPVTGSAFRCIRGQTRRSGTHPMPVLAHAGNPCTTKGGTDGRIELDQLAAHAAKRQG